jgi:predicted peroxiredoxin/TusA-related sulfurtransferase
MSTSEKINSIKPTVKVLADRTWKPDIVAYKIAKEMRDLENGALVEAITRYNQGFVQDIKTWAYATGHIFQGSEKKGDKLSLLVQKGTPKTNERSLTVVLTTAALEHVRFPLAKAFSGAILGMEVNIIFEGAGVRLLKKGYRSKLSGIGGLFTGLVEKLMRTEIGWPLPQESIKMMVDLGAHIYVCGTSLVGYGVEEDELFVEQYTLEGVVTTVDLLAKTDVHIFSRAVFEKP